MERYTRLTELNPILQRSHKLPDIQQQLDNAPPRHEVMIGDLEKQVMNQIREFDLPVSAVKIITDEGSRFGIYLKLKYMRNGDLHAEDLIRIIEVCTPGSNREYYDEHDGVDRVSNQDDKITILGFYDWDDGKPVPLGERVIVGNGYLQFRSY